MLATQNNLPAEAKPAKFYINQAGAVAARGNQHVGLREIGIEIEDPGDCGMPGAAHHQGRLLDQPLLMNGFARGDWDVDGKVEGAAREFRFQISTLDPRSGNR